MTERGRWSFRVTAFGLLLLALLVVGAFVTPVVADPEIAGVAWTAVASIVAVGILWPIVAVFSIRLEVRSGPSDVTVGGTGTFELALRGIAGGVDLRIVGGRQPWRSADVPDDVEVPMTPSHRGCFEEVKADVRVTGPLGVLRARRRISTPLPRPLWVGPMPTATQWSPDPMRGRMVQGSSPAAAPIGDVVRSVRPYATGDPAHLVHWPSTARSGSLVVRELEPPASVGLAIVVALGRPGADDEAVVGRAAGLVRAVQEIGGTVVLCTSGPDGPQASVVQSTIESDRILAVAGPGPTGAPPAGWPVEVVGP